MGEMQVHVVLGDRKYNLMALQTKEKADGSTNTWWAYVPAAAAKESNLGFKAARTGFKVKRGDALPEVAIFTVAGQTLRVPLSRSMTPSVDDKGKPKRSYARVSGTETVMVDALDAKKAFTVSVSTPDPGFWNIKVTVRGVGGGSAAYEDDGEVVSSAQLKKLGALL